MASNTTEQDSDDSFYKSRRKTRRQRVSSFSSDDSVIARPHRRKKCRVSSSSSDSDDSLLARPSRKKCKVLSDSESDSTATSDSEEEEILSRRHQKRPQRNAMASDSEATPEKGSAVANNPVTADLNSSDSDEGEKCIICFKSLKPPFGHPSNCSHHFHPKCLATWSKTSNTCPIDRVKYTAIHVVDHKGDLVSREAVTTPPPQDHNADFEPDDATFCEVCSQHDREHEMLLCDRCEAGYHLDCLTPPLREVPDGNWFCPICTELGNELAAEMNVLMDDAAIILESRMRQRSSTSAGMPSRPRTRGAQRVFNIIHHQQSADQPSTSSVTIRRQRTSSHRARRSKSSRRPQSTRYKVELITVEDGTTLEVKVAVNTRTRTKKHSRRKSKKKCSKSSHKSGGPSTSRDAIFTGEGPSRSLDLFGSRPQLDYFSGCEAEDELDEDGGRGGGVTALRGPRPGVRNMASRKQIAAQILNSRPRRPAPSRIEVSRAPVDLVSSIIEQQEKWHSPGASYESTSNGDIRVIMKESGSKIRQAGGSSGGSSSNAPSTSAHTSSSSSQPSRDTGSTGSGSAGGSRETSNAPQPSSTHSSRICEDDLSKTSGSSEKVPSPKVSSSSEVDRDEKDTDEASLCEKTRGKLDSDFPLQPSHHNPSLLGNKEEENNETVEDNNDTRDERSPSQLPSSADLHEVPQRDLSADEEPECPIQGIYSKTSQEIAVSRNYAEHSDNDDETPPADSGSVNSAADTPFDDQRVPEDLSMKKTSDCDENVESITKEDKCLDVAAETKNEVECNKQDAACEQDGFDDKPEDLTMVDSGTRGRKETDVEECENDNEEEELDGEQDNSSSGKIVEPKGAIVRESTDDVVDDEELISGEKDDVTQQEVDEGQDECGTGDFTDKNDSVVQKISEKQDDEEASEAEIPIAHDVADVEDDDADVRDDNKVPCINDSNVTPEGITAESEVSDEKVPDDLSSSVSLVGNDDVPYDTKTSFIDANLSELSDGELADEVAEERPPNEEYDSKSNIFEEDPISSCASNANLDDQLSKDAGDRGHQLGCSSNENQEINYSECEISVPKPDLNDSQHGDPVEKTSEGKCEMDSCTKILNSENEQEAQGEQGDLLEIGCEEEKDGLVDITDEEISSYERSWEMEENGEKNKKEGLEGLETEAISDCESQPVDPDVSQRKESEESLEFQPSNEVTEEASKEEEGEIVTEEGSPVQKKKISKDRNYRGDMKAKDKKKDSSQNNDKQSEPERYEARRVITEKPRKKGDFRRDISSDTESTSLSSSIGRSISRDRVSRSKSRSKSRARVKEKRDRLRDRSREHSKSRSRDRNKGRTISREKNRRNRSRDRQSRSRSRKRRRSRTPRRDRGRSRERGSRERRKRKRSPSSSCSSCSCSSCEREKKRNKKLTVIVPNEGKSRERSRDRKNKKEKRRSRSRNRKRKTPVPSKEVFTSGNNILVSVNFKSSNAEESARGTETAPPSKRKRDDEARKKKDKRTKENQQMRSIVTKKNTSKRKKINTSNIKPVAIIDLDASPFRETTLSPKEVIILTDSDDEDKLARTESAMQMSGPKTPPEPHIKFSITNNSKQQQQLRGIPNPLMDKAGREDDDMMHIGPNTPPEPSAAYDPFEPTKSRSPSPGPTSRSDRIPSPPSDAKQRHSPLQSQISMTPPKLSQHDSPKTPSPLQSMPKDMDDVPDKNKQLPAGLDSGDDSVGGGGDSPYSPGSSEGDDLFEPPMPQSASVPKPRPRPVVASQSNKTKLPPPKVAMHTQKRSSNISKEASKKGPVKKDIGMKLDEDQLKILDDLPNSAVEMQVKDKFLKKLNRQERVVEEVKLVLKPHYAKKHVSKEEYKEILRRSVPKICHSRSGEINPMKIQRLVEAYVKKYRHRMKRKGGAPAIPPLRQNKPVVVKTQWA